MLNKLLLHPNFNNTITELNKLKIDVPPYPSDLKVDFEPYTYPPNGDTVIQLEENEKYSLSPKNGEKVSKTLRRNIMAYDESFQKYSTLEGDAFFTSHSLILMDSTDYLPLNYLTFYFYSRSSLITKNSKYIMNTKKTEIQQKIDYCQDRANILTNNIPSQSIIFIDGPIIGKQMSRRSLRLSNDLIKNDIMPIFIVKNSASDLVTNYMAQYRGKYHSDMHWSYKFLNSNERTCFYQYFDKKGSMGKVFCYLKSFDLSPQRIEFDIDAYRKYKSNIEDVMNLILYFIYCQGDYKNPQIRPIAIAEKYARETIHLYDIYKLIKYYGVETMNQKRFG